MIVSNSKDSLLKGSLLLIPICSDSNTIREALLDGSIKGKAFTKDSICGISYGLSTYI